MSKNSDKSPKSSSDYSLVGRPEPDELRVKKYLYKALKFFDFDDVRSRLVLVVIITPLISVIASQISTEGEFLFISILLSATLSLLIAEILHASNSKGLSILIGISKKDENVRRLLESLQESLSLRGIEGHQYIDDELNRLIQKTCERLEKFPQSEVLVIDKYRERAATTKAISECKKRTTRYKLFCRQLLE